LSVCARWESKEVAFAASAFAAFLENSVEWKDVDSTGNGLVQEGSLKAFVSFKDFEG
jgi:hypothetical protein